MNSQEYRNLQEAYLNVYQEIDEATAMAKRGYDEAGIRNTIADKTIKANTKAGRTVDKATALEDKPTYGNIEKKEIRQKHARAQRGTFHSTNSSNPGLHGNPYNPNNKPSESDPNSPERVKELQGARGKQRARVGLTPNERKLYTSYEYDRFDTILEYLISEGYADTNENALVIMANMSEEWRESIVEAGRLHTSSDQQVGFARINDQESGGRGKKPMSDAEIKKQKGGQEFLDRIARTKKDPKYKG